jgi:HTH-type transcriptional regulator, competence development regulator
MTATVGEYLRAVRMAEGLTLRAVQDRTQGRVKNGYLSQIENGDIKRPSPTVLNDLAAVYGLDYAALLELAGHPVPRSKAKAVTAIASIPQSALADLDDREQREVLDFLAYLRSRRSPASPPA